MKHGKDVRVCVIGAGPSGITAIKHLLQVGITNIVGYDKNSEVGGNWIYSPDPSHSSVYENSHIISSKRLSQYHDYPMPDYYPDYPDHTLLKKYFQSYADHFGVTPYYQFNTEVKDARMREDYTWEVELSDGSIENFDYLIASNGHHWNPRWPDFEGEFTGEYMHSHFYKNPLPFRGKRVLIIGAGNSACDIAVDISRHAEFTGLSWRRGYYVMPKLMFGQPPDIINARLQWIPSMIRKPLLKLTNLLVVGKMENYGLPKPDHDLLASHPILNTQLLYQLKHGKIHPRKNIKRFDGRQVEFEDGLIEEYDTVIAATGYKITFPFFKYSQLDYSDRDIDLYLHVFHPDFPSLAIIGLVQPQGCIWPLSDTQSQLVANYIIGNYQLPSDIHKRIDKEIKIKKKRYINTPRHSTEVDYHEYLKKLRKEVPKNAPEWNGKPKLLSTH